MAMIRRILNLMLVSLLIATMANAAQQGVLGSIVNAAGAQMNSGPASAGATVSNGAQFLTGADGMLLVQVGAAQLSLGGTSVATLRRGENGAEASLEGGTLSVNTAQAGALAIAMGGATLRPAADVSSYAQVRLVEPRVYLINIQRGSWKFKYQCEERTLPGGSSFRLYLDRVPVCATTQSGSQQGAKGVTSGYGSGNRMLLAVAAGGAAGLVYWGYKEITESPSAP